MNLPRSCSGQLAFRYESFKYVGLRVCFLLQILPTYNVKAITVMFIKLNTMHEQGVAVTYYQWFRNQSVDR